MRIPKQTRPTIAQRWASASVATVRRAICGHVYLSTPSIAEGRFTLAPSTCAASYLAYEAHAPVLGDHERNRSGQRAGQPLGRVVARTDVCGLLFGDLASEVQRPLHALYVRPSPFVSSWTLRVERSPEFTAVWNVLSSV